MKRPVLTLGILLSLSCLYAQEFNGQEVSKLQYFCIRGHGLALHRDDFSGTDAFIENHGAPLRIEIYDVTANWERDLHFENDRVYLHYGNFTAAFYRVYDRSYNDLTVDLSYIVSSDEGVYIFGIHIGMKRSDFFKIFDIKDKGGDEFRYTYGMRGDTVTFYFDNEKLIKIIWVGSVHM
jgi:hypothetical protein